MPNNMNYEEGEKISWQEKFSWFHQKSPNMLVDLLYIKVIMKLTTDNVMEHFKEKS